MYVLCGFDVRFPLVLRRGRPSSQCPIRAVKIVSTANILLPGSRQPQLLSNAMRI